MHKWLKNIVSEKELPLTFIRFYAVGLILFMVPFTRSFFVSIIPLSLLLVIAVVLYHHTGWSRKITALFLFIYLSSFLLEMLGVNTGLVFGNYIYEKGLGWQINGTPIIIGLNWFFLVYASHDIAAQVTVRPIERIVSGSLIMILYDVVMEWVAPYMQMWRFADGYPPWTNFAAWFTAAIIYQTGFELLKIKTGNLPARALFLIQIIFFVLIGIYSYFFLL